MKISSQTTRDICHRKALLNALADKGKKNFCALVGKAWQGGMRHVYLCMTYLPGWFYRQLNNLSTFWVLKTDLFSSETPTFHAPGSCLLTLLSLVLSSLRLHIKKNMAVQCLMSFPLTHSASSGVHPRYSNFTIVFAFVHIAVLDLDPLSDLRAVKGA